MDMNVETATMAKAKVRDSRRTCGSSGSNGGNAQNTGMRIRIYADKWEWNY